MGGEHFVLVWVDHAILDLCEETFWYGCRVNPLKRIGPRIDYLDAIFRSGRVDISANIFGANLVPKVLTSNQELRPCDGVFSWSRIAAEGTGLGSWRT